jgi:orotate phosphoribosyltransferase
MLQRSGVAMPDAHDVARALVEAGAVLLTDGESDPPSGALTLDVTRLSSHPQQRDVVREALVAWLTQEAAGAELVVSPNIKSLPLATMAASALGLPMAYLRAKPKAHGRKRQVEGVMPAGARTLLLYDDLAADTPVQDSKEIIEAHGGAVFGVRGLLGDVGHVASCLTSHAAIREALAARSTAPGASEFEPARKLPVPSAERASATRERVAEILLAVGAVSINSEQPFRYASGLLSPIYTDNRLLISHPKPWGEVIAGYADALAGVVARQPVDVLAGAATAGVPHGARLAEATDVPMTFIDLNENDGNLTGKAYGWLNADDHVVIVEDLVTTGKSVFESVGALRERGALVDWCLAIFTYDAANIGAILGAEGLGFTALSDITTLLEVGVRGGQLTEADRAAVVEWLADPKAWSAAAEARLAPAPS